MQSTICNSQERKQEVTDVVSLFKIAENIPRVTMSLIYQYFVHFQKKQGAIPKHLTPRGGMRYNSLQLQNYLRHMSKQRKIMEEIAAEKYRRMTTIAVNKSLTEMAPSETSVQA